MAPPQQQLSNVLIYESYRKAECKCCILIFKLAKNVIINSNNLCSFYRYDNSKISNHRGIGTLLHNSDSTHSHDEDKADLLKIPSWHGARICDRTNGYL